MEITGKHTWLITGGAGFIGSHTARLLVKNKQKVIIFDDLSTGNLNNLTDIKNDITFINGSVTQQRDINKIPASVDYILHTAARISVPQSIKTPEETFSINTQGTINILEFSKNVKAKKVVLSSSAAIYGNSTHPCSERDNTDCQSPYALSKLKAEESLKNFYSLYNLSCVCLRYFNVFGPSQRFDSLYAAVIAKFIDCFIKKQPLTVFGDGLQTRDFVFVQDIARANIFAALNLDGGEVYNIATGRSYTLLEIIDILSELFNYKPKIIFKPERAGDIKSSFADISKISALGFKINYNLKQGLKEILKK